MSSGQQIFAGMPAVIASQSMREILQIVERIAQTDVAVLITGETGSGKEVIARAIHHYSLRSNMPCVEVNCGGLPEPLVESELFGYEKGAFSGADTPKKGFFELAHTGTMFLDEVGELEPKIQVKLLRVLDGVPYYRLGGTKKTLVDVRIIAATNLDLEEQTAKGAFRSDLFHRLSQVQITVPPLRERKDDIIPLAEFFLKKHNANCYLSEDAMQALRAYYWPGNIRELRNLVIKAAILSESEEITASMLPKAVAGSTSASKELETFNLAELERRAILAALAKTEGHQQRAAELLGISTRTLTRKLKTYSDVPAETAAPAAVQSDISQDSTPPDSSSPLPEPGAPRKPATGTAATVNRFRYA